MNTKLFVITAALALAGCVTGTRAVELAPSAYENDKTAEGKIFIADISDDRAFEQKPAAPSGPSVNGVLADTDATTLSTLIGRQRNGYGKAMGDVQLPEGSTVQEEMRDLLTEGLESRGYSVTDDPDAPIQLAIDIDEFWAWFTPGFVAVKFEAQLNSELQFSGDIDDTFAVEGYAINKAQVASDANWQLAYKRAFDDFLKNLDAALDNKGL